jgi:hypothetical protein
MSPGGLEGVADDDPYGIQWQAWRRPVPACLTVSELLPQCPAWCCTRGGGRLQFTVAGMVPRWPSVTTWPCKVTGKHFEGVAGPLRGLGTLAVREQAARRRGADTGHAAQSLGSPGRVMAPPRCCQSIKCPYPHAGTGVRVRSALERGGACSRLAWTLERGGTRSR